ncbi:hypothetical protein HK407_08g12410 [Ordospora pajunii]|jgi:hypothetical protein|uniref:uncharacterized protein n=1 Tax=Ordospora pajunii TaxID=3039483 RepID=UPI002952693B|nr:uncharacterized protein HK407_08g12410 [Ordospora pajunii]KAH9411097.1 hypothetical protein HK407_08g12410 [Ordospora pajunii]
MPSIDEIIVEKDLCGLFRAALARGDSMVPSRHRVIGRIRALGPLSIDDLEGFMDREVVNELERFKRWSVLKEIKR